MLNKIKAIVCYIAKWLDEIVRERLSVKGKKRTELIAMLFSE